MDPVCEALNKLFKPWEMEELSQLATFTNQLLLGLAKVEKRGAVEDTLPRPSTTTGIDVAAALSHDGNAYVATRGRRYREDYEKLTALVAKPSVSHGYRSHAAEENCLIDQLWHLQWLEVDELSDPSHRRPKYTPC